MLFSTPVTDIIILFFLGFIFTFNYMYTCEYACRYVNIGTRATEDRHQIHQDWSYIKLWIPQLECHQTAFAGIALSLNKRVILALPYSVFCSVCFSFLCFILFALTSAQFLGSCYSECSLEKQTNIKCKWIQTHRKVLMRNWPMYFSTNTM